MAQDLLDIPLTQEKYSWHTVTDRADTDLGYPVKHAHKVTVVRCSGPSQNDQPVKLELPDILQQHFFLISTGRRQMHKKMAETYHIHAMFLCRSKYALHKHAVVFVVCVFINKAYR